MRVTPEVIKGFTASVLAARYDEPKPIPKFHEEMWALCCDPHRRVAIAAPRGHAKSTAITFAYILAQLMFRESQHVLVISANEQLASGFLHDIKMELQENETLQSLFELKGLVKDSETEIIGEFKDGHRFRIIAKGAQQRMRGTKWERKRPDLVVADDMEDDETVLNQDRREKFRRWFYGAVIPIVKGGGKIRIVGTIVHMDAFLERLMPDPKKPSVVIEPLREYDKEKRPWKAVKYRAHNEDYSRILWPEQFPPESLIEIKEDFKEQGLLDVYGQEYLNDPVDQSTAYFKEEDFLDFEGDPSAETPRNYYVGVDFAISQEDRADFTSLVVVGLDHAGRMTVVHARKGRWDAKEIIENLFQVNNRYRPDTFFVEKGAIEKAIGPFLYSEMRSRGEFFHIQGKTPVKDKITRARSIQARMRAGGVYFMKDNDWFDDLYEEMRRFPKGRHDDQVDALAWIGLGLEEMIQAPSEEDLLDEAFWDDYESYLDEQGGRNKVTGY